ncbi:hypothetical protein LEP1GSC194_2519 [Leptospira alstonii serovar Sichuan str. 79601]|uniref:Uncharacterized protein n=1 Tax=Leptospira alstonii serovar Sichuan str. 79601 TaxID=1218565 RepID=M6DI25_9LEPT|nr:hypothetical protein LEP1GSC194_2519 [Leptospira alstonii serovar Sichuan str. 79601]
MESFWARNESFEVAYVLQFTSYVSSQTFREKTVFFLLDNPQRRFSFFSDSPFDDISFETKGRVE